MKPGKDAYQNLLVAAAELHYLASEESCCEAKARKTVLAFDLERCARELLASKIPAQGSETEQKRPDLRIVHDVNSQIYD